ncbi:SDR family NAD(P)-dependent oxidoreductase [Micromonospora sp. WMMD718]|uniref:SDR family NAD(P)-dependent oxidoreductase n=1 Tax=unclassified Micromonospora TaxID=2617518 RepID=UPI00064BE290|nr:MULTISPECIES: SDR family NAD(P)-dependent oxidoreductase [unclassified Micromonospora]MDG4752672.1 SDR family NAD(P)-dependent oxidoreductase [Micromonospora sp. WMMD718]
MAASTTGADGQLDGTRAVTTVTAQDQPLREHLVHSVPVLPGVFLIDLILRLVRRSGVAPADVEIRGCLFLAPVIDRSGTGRRIRVEIDARTEEGHWPVTVSSTPTGSDDWEDNCRAQVRLAARSAGRVDIAGLLGAATETYDIDRLYSFVRGLDIRHTGFMKADGTVHLGDGFAVADMHLDTAAQPYLDHFAAHPAVLDFATLVPMALMPEEQRRSATNPFIPLYIESVRCHAPVGTRNLIHVPNPPTGGLDADLFEADIDICAPDGALLVRMAGFRAKRIRAAAAITDATGRGRAGVTTVAAEEHSDAPPTRTAGGDDLAGLIRDLVAERLRRPAHTIETDQGFYDLGLDSTHLLAIAGTLERRLGTTLYPTLLFEHPTVRQLAAHLHEQGHHVARDGGSPSAAVPPPAVAPRPSASHGGTDAAADTLAVVGLAGHYPGADDPERLWARLLSGESMITEIPTDRWDHDRYFSADRGRPGRTYGRWGAFYDGFADFEPEFFHLTGDQALLMDPHERLFLRTAWEAFEDAGHRPEDLAARCGGAVGVFAGVMWNDYTLHGLDRLRSGDPRPAGSWPSALSNRVSHQMDLHGPSLTVDTACSAALTALHLAKESIRRGECRAALVGGVNLSLHPYKYLRLADLGLLSARGRCRPFARDADGYVPGEGVGVVLVRPLAEAVADGDHIYGLVRGTALRHSGRTAGYSVPNPDAQLDVMTAALADAAVAPETVTLIEAHASSTVLGDQIEFAALSEAYGSGGSAGCALGSVKETFGHLEAAAGIVGLTKILMAMRHRTVPPLATGADPHSAIHLDGTRFHFPRRPTPWLAPTDPRTGAAQPLRAALSAFGAGGANAHAIIEEYRTAARDTAEVHGTYVVPLSARTAQQLETAARRLGEHLDRHPELSPADVAHTLQHGRRHHPERLAVVASTATRLREVLHAIVDGREPSGAVRGNRASPPVAAAGDPSDVPVDLARRWVAGETVTWPDIPGARRVPLPTYPFSGERYWLGGSDTAPPTPGVDHARPAQQPVPTRDAEVVYLRPVWAPLPAAPHRLGRDDTVLLLDAGPARATSVRSMGPRVVQVRPGAAFRRVGDDLYEVRPGDAGHLTAVLDDLRAHGVTPTAALDLWHLDDGGTDPADLTPTTSMFALCQAMVTRVRQLTPILFAYAGAQEQPHLAAVGGLARSVRLEQPKLAVKVVWFTDPPPSVADILDEAADVEHVEVRRGGGDRHALMVTPLTPSAQPTPVARPGGIYLVAGGTGGLGAHTARMLAAAPGVTVVLASRSPADATTEALLTELRAGATRAEHHTVDITDPHQVRACVAEIEQRHGPLTGVVHSAGSIEDALIVNKSADSVQRVLAAKVRGTVNLDLATRHSDLEFFLIYSSVASVLGSAGAADYAAGNRFADAFAAWRDTQRLCGDRRGRTVAVNWPLWRHGGMRPDPAVADLILDRVGMTMLETSTGLAAIEVALAHPGVQTVVLHGDRSRMLAAVPYLAPDVPGPPDPPPSAAPPPLAATEPTHHRQTLADVLAHTTDLLRGKLNGGRPLPHDDDLRTVSFLDLGLSSQQLVEVAAELERELAVPVPPTDMFRYPDAERLAAHLSEQRPVARSCPPPATPPADAADRSAIAVIGMAGRFPGSRDVTRFWRDLAEGRDLVTAVPAGRRGTAPDTLAEGLVPHEGGFLDDVARFDAPFFGISKAEADSMDPQLRLLLEVLYETADAAAVTPSVRGSATGMFVGRCFHDYADDMIANGRDAVAYDVTGTAVVMAANRASHHFDLTGPSLTVDTACSSSLYAVHLAVQALRDGSCDMAFAAGVNLILTAPHYRRSLAIGALSPSGRCHSFDERADGYVPAEAVGAVLLKPLDRALADGDPVLAVIRGSAVNHGGHAGSLTAPHPQRQSELLRQAWADAGVDPAGITYFEAHGTGTKLGDPIEVDAITTAMRRHTTNTGFCALGSAKAHLGHAEGAAGIVSLIKVILSMRHGMIPAMPSYQRLNPYCALDDSPLFINTEPVEWSPGGPRRAAVSSFGFGGANAHCVVEEAPARSTPPDEPAPLLFPYSAIDDDRLHDLVRRHRDHLQEHADLPLAGVSATLVHGRDPLPARVVLIASSMPQLLRQLDRVLRDGVEMPAVYNDPDCPVSAAQRTAATQWAAGTASDLPGPDAVRLTLPAHPFAGNRYWYRPLPTATAAPGGQDPSGADDELRRWVHDSAFSGRRVATGMDRLDGLVRRWCRLLFPSPAVLSAGADPRYDRLVAALTELLARTSSVDRTDDNVALTEELDALTRDHPELAAWTNLVRVCLPQLPAIIAGDADPLEVYFAPQHPELLAAIYRDSAIARHFNDLAAQAVTSHARHLGEPGRPVRVLEIGAGTGGTTHAVLAALEEAEVPVRYTFTDVSPSFLPTARTTFASRRTPIEFRVLDLDRPLADQGFAPSSADIVIAANAVHATRDVAESVRRVAGLLTPGGLFVLQELTRSRDFVTAMIGALPGYWASTDPSRRLPGSPLLTAPMWRSLLAGNGFSGSVAYGSADQAEADFDNSVIVAVTAPSASTTGEAPLVVAAVRTKQAPAEPAAPAGPAPVPEPPPGGPRTVDAIRHHLRTTFGEFFGVPEQSVDPAATFDKLGMDSLSAIQLARALEADFGELSKVLLFEHPTIDDLAEHLSTRAGATALTGTPTAGETAAATPTSVPETDDPVVIVGMAAKFPRSADLGQWWDHLARGADLVTEIPSDRFDWREVYGDPRTEAGRVNSRWGAFCDGVGEFDAAFFGVTPFEAELMDPQQRILLQTAWRAVEDAGHGPGSLRGSRTGVFVGATSRDYDGILQAAGRHREGHFITSSGHCLIANRLSYHLDLRGPSEAVDTACSSSLTALHRGVTSIRAGECDAAIVGGVHLFLTPDLFVALGQLGVLSPDGRCATFDAQANGMVRGEGAVAVLLKPLSRALADGDTVHAVIRGSGVSHGGGRHASSLMMPEPAAQAELITRVYRNAGVDPRTVAYVEAHGTATQLGDPVEVRGLRMAFADLTGQADDQAAMAWCGLGSVKSNMGHLEAAAGLTGVVKMVLAMRHGVLPPTIHYTTANPLLELAGSPFYVLDRPRPWAPAGLPRRAAVSSFGLGGTNAHVLLEDHPHPPRSGTRTGPHVLCLSARTGTALIAAASRLADFLDSTSDLPDIADVAHTLRVGRDEMPHRLAVVAGDLPGAATALTAFVNHTACPGVYTGTAAAGSSAPVERHSDPHRAAQGWVTGGPAWQPPDSANRPRRVSLPTYPFAPDRHWVVPPAGDAPPADLTELLLAVSRGRISVERADDILGGVS